MPGLGYATSSPSSMAVKSRVSNPTSFAGNANANAADVAGNGDAEKEKPKLDPSDPRVRKLVYSMYRDMLTSRNTEANDIISKKDPAKVTQDSGVMPILESIVLRQRSTQGGGSDSSSPTALTSCEGQGENVPSNGTSAMPPPPPPPPMMPGTLPAVRLNSEIGTRDKGPPAALAGAMMKDKKPFTYTPGGIDLSEIRSPRMAKRIQMNAAAEGVTNTPSTPSSSGIQDRAPLPPAAFAAMQPQMAIPVFPQGNVNAVQLNKSHKPVDYVENIPPPPPPPMMATPSVRPQTTMSVPPQNTARPVSPQINLQPRQLSPPHPKSPPPPPARTSPLPEMTVPPRSPVLSSPRSPVPSSPRSPVQTAPKSPVQFSPRSPLPSVDSFGNTEERRSPLGRMSPQVAETSGGECYGTGSLFIPPIQSSPQFQAPAPPPPPPLCTPPSRSPLSSYVPPSSRPAGQTKAQAVSQNIGSLYIPPIDPKGEEGGNTSNGSVPMPNRPFPGAQQTPFSPQSANIPATPQLNKAPVPWMNSYNRMQNLQGESPPYVHPGFFMPPWGPPPAPGGSRTIPIMLQRESDQADAKARGPTDSRRSSSSSSASASASGSRTPSQAAAHLGRVIPIQIERDEASRAKGGKIIPIQVEGRLPRVSTPTTPMTPTGMMNPMRRVVPTYNSPIGLYSNQNVQDARQAADAAATGMERMNVRCESPRMDPMQSKSLRVIQQAAENELKRIEQEQEHQDDRHLMTLIKSQVDDGSSSMHQTAEPRFMGGHIPSKAFKALQTALPASPGTQHHLPPSYPAAQPSGGGPVTHHIPIRQVAQSPNPQSQSSEIQLNPQSSSSVPVSEQRVQEPKKYMGSNIPSRSFKILQAMTSEDGQPVMGSADDPASSASEQNIIADSCSDEYYDDDNWSVPPPPIPFPYSAMGSFSSQDSYPLSHSGTSNSEDGGLGSGSFTFDPYGNPVYNNSNSNNNNNNNPSKNIDGGSDADGGESFWSADSTDPQAWDPYTYMWYYWWYYASCYWAGYDMTGYEYPPGWDPNYPSYCPPELFTDYSSLCDYTTPEEYEAAASSSTPEIGSKSDLHKTCADGYYTGQEDSNEDDGNERKQVSSQNNNTSDNRPSVPQIIIEDENVNNSAGVISSSVAADSNLDKRRSMELSIKDNSRRINNSSNSHNIKDGPISTTSNALTECNRKPGNPSTLPYKKRNDCDDGSGGAETNLSKWNQSVKDNDNDHDDEEEDKGKIKKGNETLAECSSSSASSSDDEYESCCEDPETKVIERETGPCNNNNDNNNFSSGSACNIGSSNKPFVTKSSENPPGHFSAKAATATRKFRNYNSELNSNDDARVVVSGNKENNININSKGEEETQDEEDEEEKTDPEADEDNGNDDYGGQAVIVEEPETPSSADDSDMGTLVNEENHLRSGKSSAASFYDGGLSIEEYHSESSESAVFDYGLKKNRLSTIDEITESQSRASSSVWSSLCNSPTAKNLSAPTQIAPNTHKNRSSNSNSPNGNDLSCRKNNNNTGKGLESEDSEESSDELSSVSVIENKSDATRGTTESKHEDESMSSSDEDSDASSSENEDNDEGEGDEDDDEAEGADTAVTVRLPLKLCFTKTKSYKDITTVMVGDSEIEEVYSSSSPQVSTKEIDGLPSNIGDGDWDDSNNKDRNNETDNEDDEPVVSFTLSLSRQTSREDGESNQKNESGKSRVNGKVEDVDLGRNEIGPNNWKNDDPDDIDFWAEITKGEEEMTEAVKVVAVVEDGVVSSCSEGKSNQGNKEDYDQEADAGFWGIITKDRSTSDFRRRNRKQESDWKDESMGMDEEAEFHNQDHNLQRRQQHQQQQWDPQESIDYKWEKDFNFWEKSSRTIETRRFSNFEITEDYESESEGIKPVVLRKERVKKYHHKRHSIPGPSSRDWDRSTLPPRSGSKQMTSAGTASSSSSSKTAIPMSYNNEQEIKEDEKLWNGKLVRKTAIDAKQMETQSEARRSLSGRQTSDSYQDDTGSWWSYWDDVTTKKNEDSGEEETAKNNEDEVDDEDKEEDSYKTNQKEGAKKVKSGGDGGNESDTQLVHGNNNGSRFQDKIEQMEESSADISVEIKLSGARAQRNSGTGESTEGDDDYQSFAWSGSFQPASYTETAARGSAAFSFLGEDESIGKNKGEERKTSLNHSCHSDATTVTTDNEDYSSSPDIKSASTSILFPSFGSSAAGGNQEAEKLSQQNTNNNNNNNNSATASISDENSDESSRSSGTTIRREDNNKTETKTQDPPSNSNDTNATLPPATVVDNEEEHELEEADHEIADTTEVSTLSPLEEIQIPVTIERNVEIQRELSEKVECASGRHQQHLQHQHHHCQEEHLHHHYSHTSGATTTTTTSAINTTSASSCTCMMGDRIARAENLLWRIERFLQESLSLGSEDDSGVMTDLSRQISDVDTDVDNDLNETEFLLTAAAVAKERRGVSFSTNNNSCNNNNDNSNSDSTATAQDAAKEHIESCNFAETISSTDTPSQVQQRQPATSTTSNFQQQSTKRARPKSDIFLETTFLSKVEAEEGINSTPPTATTAEENNGVKMRSASERRALRYQRAKTHSRLFQLLQDECGRDEEQDEFDYDSDVGTLTTGFKQATTNNNSKVVSVDAAPDCQINMDSSGSGIHRRSASCINVMDDDDVGSGSNNNECTAATASISPTRMNDAQARRSRLLPLPIKNLLASSLSLDSNSSPSGSSGVLSPTSPVNRDQLLADIINEFHLRNQASTMRAQNQRRISSAFPSKIFKLLQHEFGEEFYQTFDCCGGGGSGVSPDGSNASRSASGGGMEDGLISPCMSTNFCVNDQQARLSPGAGATATSLVHECTIHKSDSMKEFEEATNRILTNLMLRNTKSRATSESPNTLSTATSLMTSSQFLQDDSKIADFLEVPLRKKKANLNRDPRSPKCTKKS